ncbi:hypothetical protein DSL64_05400 [Dyadobacter luteus]|uniref:DUF748 domain-containing protein n=1 Tax=Dyadobacter luteus TaxID=2259619 RepID=A0A3D8YEQ4_9BACT|nr:DUF748 domain-containing protein [Dyadobacter luteus]REA63058.1 hypothetical protein DSL64_05400 [Dyadobacter luteus]
MKRTSRKRLRNVLLIVIGLLIIFRIALPYVVLHYANKTLAEMDGYYGHIEDIDLAIIRGAYKIDSIYLNKSDTATGNQTPFFSAGLIDLSVEWKALFKGSIVSKITVDRPQLIFTKDKVEPKQVVKDSADFKKVLEGFMPLDINVLTINNGTIRYKDNTSSPKVDIEANRLFLTAKNLKNSYDSSTVLPATIDMSAMIYEGNFDVHAKLNPLGSSPTFDVSAELKNTNLVKLNDFFQAYAKVDVNDGRFGLYSEVAAKENAFTGYVKPVINNLDILGKEDRKDNLLQKLWEAVAGGVGELFENQRKDQVATKIPFKGKLDSPSANIWIAIGTVLQNAFIHALQPSIDNEINIGSVKAETGEKKTLLQKVFGSKDKEEKKGKKEKK